MKIPASKIKAGMVVAIKRKVKYDDIVLVLAKKGFTEVEYTFLGYQNAYGGALVGSIKGTEIVKVIIGIQRKAVIKSIKDDVFKNYFDLEHLIDMIRLIEDMERK